MLDKNLSKKIAQREREINGFEEATSGSDGLKWNLLFLFLGFGILMIVLFYNVFRLQVLEGEKMYSRSYRNQVKIIDVYPRRGIIFDRNGEKLVENIPSVDCYLDLKPFLNSEGILDDAKLRENVTKLESILIDEEGENGSLLERIYLVLENEPDIERILLASNLKNDTVIEIKALKGEILGVNLDEGVTRRYLHKEPLTHILGYTGILTPEDFNELDYADYNDIVGRTGIEKFYDKYLIGQKGKVAVEVNALGKVVSKSEALFQEAVSGSSLYLTIDLNSQKKAYEILQEGVKEFGATSGSLVLQNVQTGEILTLANYPSYDNNLFVEGISQEEFEKILYTDGNPLTNKAIAAQVPPGSMFKSIVAAAGLDAGALSRNTVYVSRRGYTFSNGAPFQEFQNKAYGALNLVDAIMLSSNIYFCEMIRNWDMNKLVPYLKNFGIGQYTGIDIPGEGLGRLPSPENKVQLARTTSPWLEPYWLPEGDSCNSVIGQGITTVTPIQAVSWISAIANDGVLYTPHLGKKLVSDTQEKNLEFDIRGENFVSKEALSIVREGMRASVAGSRRVIIPLTDAKTEVAAKTGTAEFGKRNLDGRYEHTHAWVNGFFPYQEPKYAFVVFLENGGASNNSAEIARKFIDWFVENINF